MIAEPGVIRREGSREVRVLGGAVVLLLAGAYLSWIKKEDKVTAEKVAIADLKPADVSGIELRTKTATVVVSERSDAKQPYYWFEVESGKKKHGFVGSKATKDLLESFAPFEALRSLGSNFKPAQIDDMKLAKPDGKLILRARGGDRTFDVGGRTYGTRDWYVRPSSSKETYLVPSRVLSDLEAPESRFMQRQLQTLAAKDVAALTIKAGSLEKKVLHQNRLSEKDAYWADADAPSARNESLENYVDKLIGLTATAYVDPAALRGATPVMELAWFEGDEPKEQVKLVRVPDGDKQKYLAVSTATILPVEVPRSTAEQLEQDLAGVLGK